MDFLFLPSNVELVELDKDLDRLDRLYLAKAAQARVSAKRARDRGDLIAWRRHNATGRTWEVAALELGELACPF